MAAQEEAAAAGGVNTRVVRSSETRWSNAANLLRLAPLTAVQVHIASVQVGRFSAFSDLLSAVLVLFPYSVCVVFTRTYYEYIPYCTVRT